MSRVNRIVASFTADEPLVAIRNKLVLRFCTIFAFGRDRYKIDGF